MTCLVVGLAVALAAAGDDDGPRRTAIAVPGATIELVIHPGPLALSDEQIAAWVENAARAVAGYYGRFPAGGARVEVTPRRRPGVGGGRARPGDPPRVTIGVGASAAERDLAEDWVMTHELTHIGFPSVAERHHWIEEGLATYVEPIARARAGQLSPEKLWGDLARDLPQGLPEAGDRGLDHTPTWGRTYWGGALFCLLADVAIRERTAGAKGLEDALAGIVAGGGDMNASWPIDRAFAAGDAAVGVPVLSELYAKMRADPYPVDLPALWKRLGVERRGGRVRLDDRAPLAAVRQAITTGRGASPRPAGE